MYQAILCVFLQEKSLLTANRVSRTSVMRAAVQSHIRALPMELFLVSHRSQTVHDLRTATTQTRQRDRIVASPDALRTATTGTTTSATTRSPARMARTGTARMAKMAEKDPLVDPLCPKSHRLQPKPRLLRHSRQRHPSQQSRRGRSDLHLLLRRNPMILLDQSLRRQGSEIRQCEKRVWTLTLAGSVSCLKGVSYSVSFFR